MNRRFVALAAGLIVGSSLAFAFSVVSVSAASSTCADVSSCIAEAQSALSRAQSFGTTTTSATSSSSSSTTTASTSTTTTTVPPGSVNPLGAPGSWSLKLADEFNGTALDTTIWNTSGTWECCDGGRSQKRPDGTYNNGEIDYKTNALPANYELGNGALTIHGLRQTAPNGGAWTGGQLGSKAAFTYGFLETRAQFSPVTGFQPALWTWGNGASPNLQETDGFEFYGDNHRLLYLTSHAGAGGSCTISLPFDPTTGMHTYGVDMESGGTSWWVDGQPVCMKAGHPSGPWNIVDYQVALNATRAPPPLPATVEANYISDYVRFWSH